MGNFDAFVVHRRPGRIPRTVFEGTVGPNARNAPGDMRIITRTLASAGLLGEDTCPYRTHTIIFDAIRHVRRTLTEGALSTGSEDVITPGDATERAVRRALAQGRLPLSHRANLETQSPRGTRKLIDSGMKRALARLSDSNSGDGTPSPYSRALLPGVSAETFHTNRRLADALSKGGELPGLDSIIAKTFSEDGKQAFSDVRDFFNVLSGVARHPAATLAANIERELSGKARRRFRKLLQGKPPDEGDFEQ